MNPTKHKFSELKQMAREAMAGRCGVLVGSTAIYLFLNFGLTMIPSLIFSGTTLFDVILLNVTLFLISLLLSLLQAGAYRIALSCLRGEKPIAGDLLYAFYHHPDQYLLMFLVTNGISAVIGLVSSIPGFTYLSSAALDTSSIAAMEQQLQALTPVYLSKLAGSLVSTLLLIPFSLCSFVMIDQPGTGPLQAIRQSFSLMKKNFFRYLLLQISFFGIYLLAACSCCIGFLWAMPYMYLTIAAFYLERSGQWNQLENRVSSLPPLEG